MTYEEMVATRQQRAVARANYLAGCCAGCCTPFARYGMTKAQAYVENGRAYCNSDCAMEAEVKHGEAAEYASLAD